VGRTTIVTGAVVAALATAALGGCASSTAEGSRARLYGSVAELAADSGAVVTGTVDGQRTVRDLPAGDTTVSEVTVRATAKADRELPAGATVSVRQMGSAAAPGPAALLQPGRTYLLFLTPTGLDGERAEQFFVTGGTAGIWETDGGGADERSTFTRLPSDDGDVLPERLTLGAALGE